VRTALAWCCIWLIVAGATPTAHAAELKPATVKAFDRYVQLTEARIQRELQGDAPFLWMDRLAGAQRSEVRQRLNAREPLVERLETHDRGRDIDVPDGMIHHWIGTVVIPGATVDGALTLFQSYDRYAEIYAPRVRHAKLIRHTGDRFRVYLRLFVEKVLTVVLNTEYDIEYRRLPNQRAHVASRSTKITEVADAGTPEERALPEGRDRGFLWRLNNYCSFEQRGTDTYMQCETVSLSRGIPPVLSLIIRPFVTSVPRESLAFTLEMTRDRLIRSN